MGIDTKQVHAAFNNLKVAIDQAMRGTFPMGMDSIDHHAQVRQSVQVIADALNELMPKPVPADAPEYEPGNDLAKALHEELEAEKAKKELVEANKD